MFSASFPQRGLVPARRTAMRCAGLSPRTRGPRLELPAPGSYGGTAQGGAECLGCLHGAVHIALLPDFSRAPKARGYLEEQCGSRMHQSPTASPGSRRSACTV